MCGEPFAGGVLGVSVGGTGAVEVDWLGVGVAGGVVAGVVGGVTGGVVGGVVGGWVGLSFLLLVKVAVVFSPGLAVILTGVVSSP